MTINVEDETGRVLTDAKDGQDRETQIFAGIDPKDLARRVIEAALDSENCPYEAEVNLLLTDNEGIHEMNREQRGIDRPTDVLSFPMLEFESPADFSAAEEDEMGSFDPETGELLLGDIVISVDKVAEQAEKYGHSREREYAFLIAHSMLHLMGYDHEEKSEAAVMEEKQEAILAGLHISR